METIVSKLFARTPDSEKYDLRESLLERIKIMRQENPYDFKQLKTLEYLDEAVEYSF